MKITIYELLGMIKDGPDRNSYVKYFDRVNEKEDVMWACKENIIYKLDHLVIELNDIVEILKEEKKIPDKWNDLSFTTMRKREDSIDDIHKLKGYIETIMRTQNEIIDYLKSKGE